MSAWTEHVARWRSCTACNLCNQRSNIVLARGQVPCDVLFVGEAPGASEDALGQPFKGPAGHLLDQIVERAVPTGLRVAFTNLVACYPAEAKRRGDNEPEIGEIKACRPRLYEFIALCKPRLIVCVGRLSSDWIGHDAFGKVQGAQVVDIVHPAHILSRMPLAQQRFAVDKCVVQIKTSIENVIQSE